ncbi:MAG: AraC family transcriptional regulator, partial [Mesorhizobium sp.]
AYTHDDAALPLAFGMRVSEIAMTSGFSDVSYFNRCFRRRFGYTPKSAR